MGLWSLPRIDKICGKDIIKEAILQIYLGGHLDENRRTSIYYEREEFVAIIE